MCMFAQEVKIQAYKFSCHRETARRGRSVLFRNVVMHKKLQKKLLNYHFTCTHWRYTF